MVEEAAAEHAHGVRQGIVMGLIVLLRVRNVVVMDKAAVVDFLRCGSLGFFQLVEILRQRRRRHRSRDRIIVILEALGYAGKEKRGQDGGVLPVEQVNDSPARVGQPPNDDIALLGVWMADAETTEDGVPRDERRCEEEIALQVLDVADGDCSWYW